MKLVTFHDKTYLLDKHGFLAHPGLWDKGFAEGIAAEQGIFDGLGDDHWQVIGYLRHKYDGENTVPLFVHACIDVGLRISEFRDLFPTGYMRGACRIAGLNYEFIADKSFVLTYENLPSLWSKYPLSPLGYLEDFDRWDEQFAHLVAQLFDLPAGLTAAHWSVIHFLRDHYRQHRGIPLVYKTCKAHNLTLEEHRTLFPGGYRRCACRMAGLPYIP